MKIIKKYAYYEPAPKQVLIEFNNEVVELGYEPALSAKVAEARNEIKKALGNGATYNALNELKSKFMAKFRNDPIMDSFNYSKYHVFSGNGEKNYYEEG